MVIDKAFKEALLDCFKPSVQQTLIPEIEKIKRGFAEDLREINSGFSGPKRTNNSKKKYSYQDNIADEMAALRTRLRKLEEIVFKAG